MNMWAMVSKGSTAELETRKMLKLCGFIEVKLTKETGRHVGTEWNNALYVNYDTMEFSLSCYIPNLGTQQEKVPSASTVVREALQRGMDEWQDRYELLCDDNERVIVTYSKRAMEQEHKVLMTQLFYGSITAIAVVTSLVIYFFK